MLTGVLAAGEFAVLAHGEQKRKYTGEPYMAHPLRVAQKVASLFEREGVSIRNVEILTKAAIMHDVLEDTLVLEKEMREKFGDEVTDLVLEVTEISKGRTDINRQARKELDNTHYEKASMFGKAIKLADSIDNLRDVVRHDPGFAKIYLPEMRARLPVLYGGPTELHNELQALVKAYFYLHGER